MKLIVVHYHLRPGGVRRIIELALPHLLAQCSKKPDTIVLASGEAPDERWLAELKKRLPTISIHLFLEPALNYISEQKLPCKTIRLRLQKSFKQLLADAAPDNCIVWCHNPSVGRNLLLSQELVQATSARNVPLVYHHHDWLFDNRWVRWPEIKQCGFRSLPAVLKAIFPSKRNIRHATINQTDASALHRCLPQAHWLPNLAECPPLIPIKRQKEVREWLRRTLKQDAPVWLLPCRLLRRKNVAEALLLTRWLHPEAWLVTTGGVSSADEQIYADTLHNAAQHHRWNLRLGLLQGNETGKPSVPELLTATDAVILTSVLEGFGLPYLEAAASRRPLIARTLPNISPDLEKFGFRFPQSYEEIRIEPRLFDWSAEVHRQTNLFSQWRKQLPPACQKMAGTPILLASPNKPHSVPFSRLTLSAQLEVLAQPAPESWSLSIALNPFLQTWRKRANAGQLKITPWPRSADKWLSGPAYAKHFWDMAPSAKNHASIAAADPDAQKEFVRERLSPSHLFPILWSNAT